VKLVYCGSGWLPIVGMIRERLPAGVTIELWDRQRSLAGAQVLLPSNYPMDAAAIAGAGDLRLIQQPAAGVENIDLEAARARGVPVCNAPAVNHIAVAEAALLLILALARRLPEARAAFAGREIGVPLGMELCGKTLGIIGLGRSGAALAERGRALGMEVIATTSASSDNDLYVLLARADVVSLHCPLTARTRGLIGRRALAAIKPGALLVNCARGPIIDRPALQEALDQGRLGGVGLDVLWEEPWDPADPLFGRNDVVVLPHVAGSTAEALARIAEVVAGNVRALVSGTPLAHRIV
jgi:phosphoglycerate dehydrogenase-like enzyme